MPSSSAKKQQKKASYLKSQLTRAASLEAQLQQEKLHEATASSLRIQLCEVFSELILSNAEYSLKKDVYGRLWRNCFYARISELRSRISRERRKQNEAALEKLEGVLKTFLKEAVALYKYLTEKYESLLLPSESQDDDDMSLNGVVAGLHRLYIYLGDLYRYDTSYTKAQECYEQASRLAPSKGNPYNQLAVVAQLKDSLAPLSCVALYYYARSLLASHDPFPTSKANLQKCLENNRTWLQQNSQETLVNSQQTTYAQKVEKQRLIKSVTIRLFLARFADLHYDFFRQVDFTERQAREGELVTSMNIVLVKLETLLKEWAFGDALLLKMVTINAFSIEWTKSSKTLARAFMLRFGAALAERLELSLKKAMEKQTLSLRLLMPLVLLSDYVSTWDLEQDSPDKALSTKAREFCLDAKQRYWTRLASIATQLLPLRNSLGLDEMDSEVALSLPEYETLQGFQPFQGVVGGSMNGNDDDDEVYLSPERAARVLELSQSQPSQSQQQQSAHDNSLKLKRFFDVVDFMVEKKQPVCCVNGQYRVYSFKSNAATIESDDDDMVMMDEDEPVGDLPSSSQEAEKKVAAATVPPRIPLPVQKNDDVLEYKQSEGGAGPALLVPGALLLNKSQGVSPSTKKQDQPVATAPAVVSTERSLVDNMTTSLLQQQVLPSTTLVPPAAAVPVAATAPPAASIPPAAPAPPPATPLGPPPGLLPPPGFGASATSASIAAPTPAPPMPFGYGMAFPPPPSTQPLPDGDTVLQMLRGMDTNTSNPFMTSDNVDSLFQSQSDATNDANVDGMSLLDSSLLSSMMMDDSQPQPQSRNPFLT